ncbi:non-specific lipid transfer protein GPI-anchored 20-like [Tasmannia lanceolata]|uniref:non-specific lipid transfer protein GPI-anchored 20-like n=1 Tax=Tasmannia lanceolata TaxID=3420 RepID=UPI0040630C04
MEWFKSLTRAITLLVLALAISIVPISGQITTGCTNSMISSFTPCLNFITGSSANGSSPTAGCCSSLSSLLSSSTDCACLILTGNVPFQLPINRALAISLPRACNGASVPLQCKGSASPLPAPGPLAFGPSQTPTPTPTASSIPESASPPPASTSVSPPMIVSAPASPPTESTGHPTESTGRRPVVTPSSAVKLSIIYSPSLLLLALAALFFF